MKAMILAAGKGTRLRPVTESLPKALVEVGGKPMIEIVLRRLIRAGVTEAVVNLHYMPAPIEAFLKKNDNFGIRIGLSRERGTILDTGGGIKKAEPFLRGAEPFFVHNVDVLSDLDLGELYRAHAASGALATLAVRRRESSRRLLFKGGLLVGREDKGRREWAAGEVEGAEALGFDGIHVLSPGIFGKMTESGAFSINAAYLRLAGLGESIRSFDADRWRWLDVGSPEKLELARREFPQGL